MSYLLFLLACAIWYSIVGYHHVDGKKARERFCQHGEHSYSAWSTWLKSDGSKRTGRCCSDCGKWDIQGD